MTPEGARELRIGRIVRAHGVKGAVRVELLTDFPDRFAVGNVIEIDGRRLTVKSSEEIDDSLLVSFAGIEDRTSAGALAGRYCTLPLSSARRLPENHFYHFQLIGLDVFDTVRQRVLGKVEEVLSYPANDVLRVSDGRREVLIPMVLHIVKKIDRAAGRITVDLPEETEA